jgi:hypothetical protein
VRQRFVPKCTLKTGSFDVSGASNVCATRASSQKTAQTLVPQGLRRRPHRKPLWHKGLLAFGSDSSVFGLFRLKGGPWPVAGWPVARSRVARGRVARGRVARGP